MKNIINKVFMALALGLFLSSASAIAAQSSQAELLNLAGKQRMLSQRIAKDYFYLGKGINKSKVSKQLKDSLAEFNKTQSILERKIKNDDIKNIIMFVNMSSEEFTEIASEEFSLDNGALVLDLSETMLEGSQYVVTALRKSYKKQVATIVDLSGKQRMLSQRIAKYYIAYQVGIKDKNSILQMKEAVKSFSSAHKKLMKNKTNSHAINKELKKVDKLWKIVYKFYNNIEKGGLPIIVFKTTDDIMSRMDKITKMYVALNK